MDSIKTIEIALREALPAMLHTPIPNLAELLNDVVHNRRTAAEAQEIIGATPALTQLARALIGQWIDSGRETLLFVAGSPEATQADDVSIILHIVDTNGGDYAEGNIDKRQGTFVDLHVHAGDPPELQQQKRMQARRLIVNEVMANIASVDAWLSFLSAALATDTTAARLADIRQKHAPAIEAVAAAGYRQLMASQQVAVLRQAFNSRPLANSFGPVLIELLLASGADASQLHLFYDLLAQIRDTADSLLDLLSAQAAARSEDERSFKACQVDLQVRVLRNRSALTHLVALRSISQLSVGMADLQPHLLALNNLQPRQLVDDSVLESLLITQIEEGERLLAERQELYSLAEHALEQSLEAYAEIEDLLTIKPSDPWNVVVGKARSLRDLGRIADAAAAFARYSELFAQADPIAASYAYTAQQFTLQCQMLGVAGGAYVRDLIPTGPAECAGLMIGDIVIGYGNQIINAMPDLVTALHGAIAELSVPLTYLRMSPHGSFFRSATMIAGGPPGAGFLPI